MGNNRRSIVRSFRFTLEFDKQLANAVRNSKQTENAFVIEAIQRRFRLDSLNLVFRSIFIDRAVLSKLITRVDESDAEKVGMEAARSNIPLMIELSKIQGEKFAFSKTMDMLSELNWFKIDNSAQDRHIFLLIHELGLNWSIFLKGYLSTAYEMTSADFRDLESSIMELRLTVHDRFLKIATDDNLVTLIPLKASPSTV
ncbi:MAG: hypothetical protein ACRDF4_11660 [Rhabdochlamydiaceae bacterium]